MKKVILIFLILICCGKPENLTTIENAEKFKNSNITIQAIFITNAEEIKNTFELEVPAPKNEKITFQNNADSIELNNLKYQENEILVLEIDDWLSLEICYSPSPNDFENNSELSGNIYFEYNIDTESLLISGDSIKDIHINLITKTVDDSYWFKNDKSVPEICM
mgnify:FL=1